VYCRFSRKAACSIFSGALCLALTLTAFPSICSAGDPPPFDLGKIVNLSGFEGGREAETILRKRGFVVTGEEFRQIFEAYLPGHVTAAGQFPRFITVDSAWQAYHSLFEDSLKDLESRRQALLLRQFSRRLYRVARRKEERAARSERRFSIALHCFGWILPQSNPLERRFRQSRSRALVFADIARFAAVAMLLQDEDMLEEIRKEDRAIVEETLEGLKEGDGLENFLFFSSRINPESLKPQGFYREEEKLQTYYPAMKWYQSCVFRVDSPAETERAIELSRMITEDQILEDLYRRLQEPYDLLLGPKEDPGAEVYAPLALKIEKELWPRKLRGKDVEEFQEALRRSVRSPEINDIPLSGKKEITFRVFSPRVLPSARIFASTTAPGIPDRYLPSGLDFFAIGPMACAAGKRALAAAYVRSEILRKQGCAELPESLHGKALRVLQELQRPLPTAAPIPLRTQAWEDKQLWTSLGAWCTLRHTWVLHAKTSDLVWGISFGSPGYVSPYPEFFRKLAELARVTRRMMGDFGLDEIDVTAAIRRLHQASAVWARLKGDRRGEEIQPGDWRVMEDFEYFGRKYLESRKGAVSSAGEFSSIHWDEEFEKIAAQWAGMSTFSEKEKELVRMAVAPRRSRGYLRLPPFAELCGKLAVIAEKELAGEEINQTDIQLIENYGYELAYFNFNDGNGVIPEDDFPITVPLASARGGPDSGLYFHGALARPEALYVIIDIDGRPVLHRGAVFSYREFVAQLPAILDDAAWRKIVQEGKAPGPPAFTASFRCREPGRCLFRVRKMAASGDSSGEMMASLEPDSLSGG